MQLLSKILEEAREEWMMAGFRKLDRHVACAALRWSSQSFSIVAKILYVIDSALYVSIICSWSRLVIIVTLLVPPMLTLCNVSILLCLNKKTCRGTVTKKDKGN